jgi:hypothetical protein
MRWTPIICFETLAAWIDIMVRVKSTIEEVKKTYNIEEPVHFIIVTTTKVVIKSYP